MTRRELDLVLGLDEPESSLLERAAHTLGCPLARVEVLRRSLDARQGRPPVFLYRVAEHSWGGGDLPPSPAPRRRLAGGQRVVVVGSGPAGTFAALELVEAGARVHVIELGKRVQPRRRDLAQLTRGRL